MTTRPMRATRQGPRSVLPVPVGLGPLSRGLSSCTVRLRNASSRLCEDPVCPRTLSVSFLFESLLNKGWFVDSGQDSGLGVLFRKIESVFRYYGWSFLIRLFARDFSLARPFV